MGSLSPAGRGPKWGSLLGRGGGESERWSGKGGLPSKDYTFFRTRPPHCELSVSRAALGYTPRAIKHFPCASLGAASAPPAAASRDAVWAAPKVVEWRVTALCTPYLSTCFAWGRQMHRSLHILSPPAHVFAGASAILIRVITVTLTLTHGAADACRAPRFAGTGAPGRRPWAAAAPGRCRQSKPPGSGLRNRGAKVPLRLRRQHGQWGPGFLQVLDHLALLMQVAITQIPQLHRVEALELFILLIVNLVQLRETESALMFLFLHPGLFASRYWRS